MNNKLNKTKVIIFFQSFEKTPEYDELTPEHKLKDLRR